MANFGVTGLLLCILWTILKEIEPMHLVNLTSLENPCRGSFALRWMRAPHTCRQYVICAAGQPIRMPSCPESHVWSVRGRNCVPKWSRWDDCTKMKPKSTPMTRRAAPQRVITRLTIADDHTESPQERKPMKEQYHGRDMMRKAQNPQLIRAQHQNITWKAGVEETGNESRTVEKRNKNKHDKLPVHGTSDRRTDKTTDCIQTGNPSVIQTDGQSKSTKQNQRGYIPVQHRWQTNRHRKPESTTDQNRRGKDQQRPHRVQVVLGQSPQHKEVRQRDQTDKGGMPLTSTAIGFPRFQPKPTLSLQDMERIEHIKRAFPNHPCTFQTTENVIAHSEKCQLYYNCSLSPNLPEWKYSEPLTQECVYPQVFSIREKQCMDYDEVDCGYRQISKNPCEYRENICRTAHCRPCHIRYGNCEGKQDGFHPFPGKEWTPEYMVCRGERNLQQLKCRDPRPIFSPETYQCEHLKNVPKHHGGLRPVCEGRIDGYYPDESGRCDIYFECSQSRFVRYKKCGGNDLYSAGQARCTTGDVEPPCGNITNNICGGLPDGYYADPYGRCPLYIHCINNDLLGYLKCPFGSYNPYTERCETSAAAPKPCGNLPNPCQYKPDGVYADLANNCVASYTCRKRFMIKVEKCKAGQVFSELIGRCGDINNTPSPCGLAPTCTGKVDGKYASNLKGCQYYYVCKQERFVKYEKCGWDKGGFYFNPEKQKCDFPMNICGACGTRSKSSCGTSRALK